jgi:hypothetical protein
MVSHENPPRTLLPWDTICERCHTSLGNFVIKSPSLYNDYLLDFFIVLNHELNGCWFLKKNVSQYF